jgi:hypothetical protein
MYEESPKESQPSKHVPTPATSYTSPEGEKPNVSSSYSPPPLSITPADMAQIPPGFCYCALYKALTTTDPTDSKPLYRESEPEVTPTASIPANQKYKNPSPEYKPLEFIKPQDSYSSPQKPKYRKPSSVTNLSQSDQLQNSYSSPPKPQYSKPKSEYKPPTVTEAQDSYGSPPNPQYRTPAPEPESKTKSPQEFVTLSGFLAKNNPESVIIII